MSDDRRTAGAAGAAGAGAGAGAAAASASSSAHEDTVPVDPDPAADIASLTATLDGALAASGTFHHQSGRAAARAEGPVTSPGFVATRNVDGASAIPGAHGLSVHGDLDIATAPVLAAMFAQPDLDHGPGFVIDLRAVTFIDLTGIRLLHDMHDQLSAAGHYAQVAPSQFPSARRILRMAVANGWLPAAFTFSSTNAWAPAPREVTPPADRVGDLRVAVRYLPAAVDSEPTAGDFFDVLPLRGGQVAMALGDVSGHGTSAALRRATLRETLRAVVLLDGAPTRVLTALERFQSLMEPDDLATLWYGLYTPATGHLTYASAGHPPPLLWPGLGGDVALLERATAPPLGASFGRPVDIAHRTVLTEGAFLIAYSDGLVERPEADIDAQIESLRLAAHSGLRNSPVPTPGELAAHLLEVCVPGSDEPRDDVCVAVVSRSLATAVPRTL